MKKALKSLQTEIYVDPNLEARLNKLLQENMKHFTAERRRKITESLEKVVFIMKQLSGGVIVQNGYRMMGYHPFRFERVLNQCSTKISGEEVEELREKADSLVPTIIKHGKITDEDMDHAGIRNLNLELYNKESKDKYTLNRQRALLLTNPNIVRERREYVTQRNEKANSRKRKATTSSTSIQKRARESN